MKRTLKNGTREERETYEPVEIRIHKVIPTKVLCLSSSPAGVSFKASKGSQLF